VREQVDADAQRFQFWCGFVDAAGDAELMEPQPQCETANARARDDDFHVYLVAREVMT
jgi:hypothetical protein